MAAIDERRRLFLDRSVGETRGVVTLRGRPERLLIVRDGEPERPCAGERWAARVARTDGALGMAFLRLGGGPDAVLPAAAVKGFSQGAAVEVEIAAEARADKGPTVKLIGPAEADAPRRLNEATSMEDRLHACAPKAFITRGPDAREAADLAEEEALATEFGLPDGGSLSIEPTRGMVACDVDVGARQGGDAKRVARATNLAALTELARLLRLKGLGGLIAVDLAGRSHDGDALVRAAREAFHADNPGVQVGGISRLGLMEISKPWREQPLRERLLDPDGRPSPATVALRLARTLEREGRVHSGARLLARCAPDVAEAFAALASGLADRLGPRFEVRADPALPREHAEVRAA